MRLVSAILLCCNSAFGQILLWDHADTPHTSFVIRRTTNVSQHWTNWPVVAIVDHTNRWKIPVQTNRVHLFTVQASNQFGMSGPPTCGVWRAQSSPERTFTATEVGQIIKAVANKPTVCAPPLPR